MAADVAERMATPTGRPVVSIDVPILAAKVTAPGLPAWMVQRPRITKLIAEGTRWRPLTVVSGPPGAGRTTALAQWAAAEPGPVAWVRVDELDNRAGVFWSYVVAALDRSGAGVARALPVTARGGPADQVFLLRLASALAAQDSPVTLAVDDLHLLTDAAALDGLAFLLRNAGPGLRLVVSSRTDPPLPLNRYRLGGELAEVRAGDLAFTTSEARLLLARHGCTLSADSLECLMRRTEGWVAGLRLAAMTMDTHPDPGRFVKELITEDSALTGYLAEELLNGQPPEVWDVLLSTCLLEQVNAEAVGELTGHRQAAAILPGLAHANAFVQPIGAGWYRYHPLLAEVLRLKLRHTYPDRTALLHRRAARWHERSGRLTSAVRHAARAGDWQLAAGMVIDGLAIDEVIEPRAGHCLAGEFRGMPDSRAWAGPQPYLVSAAAALSAGKLDSSAVTLGVAEGMIGRLPPDQQATCRLASAMIRLAASRRTGDRVPVAASDVEMMASRVPADQLARHPEIRARTLAGRGAAALWSGDLDQAARALESAVAAAAPPGMEYERADCLGHLALVEALRGRLGRAAGLAAQATATLTADRQPAPIQHPNPAALAALAWVDLEHNKLRETHTRLKQVDAALDARPDKLIGAVACLAAAYLGLARGRTAPAAQILARARSGWRVPAWLEQRLTLTESRVQVAAGDIPAALAAAGRAACGSSPEAAAALAHAWLAAGDRQQARRALAPALATVHAAPARARLQVWLADAHLSYEGGDVRRGRRSLASALRLGRPEQVTLPFALERAWIEPVLLRDSQLARAHRQLIAPATRDHPPVPPGHPDQAGMAPGESLTEREREVLRHISQMLSCAEVASELYISINTVKTHLRSIYRKLGARHRGEAVRRARQLELI